MEFYILKLFLIFGVAKFSSGTVITAFDTNDLKLAGDLLHTNFTKAIRSRNTLYGAWPTPTAIPYRISSAYAASDLTRIQTAMNNIAANMGNCIRFVPYVNGTDSGKDFLQISPTLEGGAAAPTCFSFPGRVLSQAGRGQKVAIISGVDGCLNNDRETMKYFANALGLRNEHNRPDRGSYITVTQETNLKPAFQGLGILTMFNSNPNGKDAIDTLTSNFDYKSITMLPQNKYVQTGQLYTANTITNPPVGTGDSSLPNSNQAFLSQGDCIGLKVIYPSCTLTCTDQFGNGGSILNPNIQQGQIISGTPGNNPIMPPPGVISGGLI